MWRYFDWTVAAVIVFWLLVVAVSVWILKPLDWGEAVVLGTLSPLWVIANVIGLIERVKEAQG